MREIKEEVIAVRRGIQGITWVSPVEPFLGKAIYVCSTPAKFKVVQSHQGQDENCIY
jgi:hypothetical protein